MPAPHGCYDRSGKGVYQLPFASHCRVGHVQPLRLRIPFLYAIRREANSVDILQVARTRSASHNQLTN